jgi:hypothetical protein
MTIQVLVVCWRWNLVTRPQNPQDHGHRRYKAFTQETLHAMLMNDSASAA